MSGSWWACHWCDWEAPVRWYPRRVSTLMFRRHLRDKHPAVEYHNTALWGRRGHGPS